MESFSAFDSNSAGDFEKDEKFEKKILIVSETNSGLDSGLCRRI